MKKPDQINKPKINGGLSQPTAPTNIVSPEFAEKKNGKAVPPNEEFIPGQAALVAFYEKLTLTPGDERKIFEKRGLATSTQIALGYRSNPRSNKEILLTLRETHSLQELVAAGLWLPKCPKEKGKERPNAQFHGYGIIGKKPKDEHGESKLIWGWCEPVLIPYFDAGRLVGLRPHKGMAPGNTLAGTPRIYVPKTIENLSATENLSTVVITEGEHKAAALWQTLGNGTTKIQEIICRLLGSRTIGVVALPGITFGKHFAIRAQLDDWLRRVECRCVKIGFDHEVKPPGAKGRFDSIIWARYLAEDLHRKLHIRAEVCVLPSEWADANGKSDWDGALAKIAKEAE